MKKRLNLNDKKKKLIFIIAIILFNCFSTCHAFNFKIVNKSDPLFLSPIEIKQKQLKELEKFSKNFLQQAKDAKNSIERRTNRINEVIDKTEKLLKTAATAEVEFHNQKLVKFNGRKQSLVRLKEVWASSEEIIANHTKLQKDFIDTIKSKEPSVKYEPSYSLKDFKSIQNKIIELNHKIGTEKFKKELAQKQKKSEEEMLSFLQKELEANKKEQKKILEKMVPSTEEVEKTPPLDLKQQTEILEITSSLLNDKKELAEILIEKLDFEIKYQEEAIKFFEFRLEEYNKNALEIQKRLFIYTTDIEAVQEEAAKEKQKSLEIINKLNLEKEQKKSERVHHKGKLESLETTKKEIQEKDKLDEAYSYFLNSQINKVENAVLSLEKEIDLLDLKKYFEDDKVYSKDLEIKIIDILYRLQMKNYEKGDLEKWFNEFSRLLKKEEEGKDSFAEKQRQEGFLTTGAKLKIEGINSTKEDLKTKREIVFKDKDKLYSNTINTLEEAMTYVKQQTNISQEISLTLFDLLRKKNDIIKQYRFILKQLGEKKFFDIWRRSPQAISLENLIKSGNEAESFSKEFVAYLPNLLNPFVFARLIFQFGTSDYLGWSILIILFLLLFLFLRLSANFFLQQTKKILASFGIFMRIIAGIIHALCYIIVRNPFLFCIWLFILLDISFEFRNFMGTFGDFSSYTDSAYLKICFYLLSIPLLLFFSYKFITKLKAINEEMELIFVPKDLVPQYDLILKFFLHSTSILIPLRESFILFVEKGSRLPDVILGIYLFILETLVIALLFIYKSELLKLIRSEGMVTKWIKDLLDKNYNFVLLYFIALLVLFNPYVGYFNLASLLIYAVPLTLFFVFILFFGHTYIRKTSASWFIKEEDEEVIDRFEHAKAYYGIFIILSFLLILLVVFIVVAKIWGAEAPLDLISYLLKERWTIDIGEKDKLGFSQLFVFTLFIAGGFMTSTLIDKFVLSKIFDVLRLDIGVQNTVSNVLHYVIIYMVIIIGLISIQLGRFVIYISTAVAVGVGLASRDLLADLIAGFIILFERPIEIGSFIEFEDKMGTVKKISPRATILKNAKQRSIIIPNRELLSKPIINWNYARSNVGFDVEVAVSYKNDPDLVKKVIMDILQGEGKILRSPIPSLRVEDFEESGFKFLVRAFISSRLVREKWMVASNLRINILKEFKNNNIVIPFPHLTIQFDPEDKKKQGPITIKFDK